MTRRALFATAASIAGVCLTAAPRPKGLDLDRMTDDEVEAYVDRMIHEHRAEQRQKQQSGANDR